MKISDFHTISEDLEEIRRVNDIVSRDTYDNLTDEEVRLLIRRKVENAIAQYAMEINNLQMNIKFLNTKSNTEAALKKAEEALAELLCIDADFKEVE